MAIAPGACELADVRLHYLEAGEGPLVVCLHGFPDHPPGMRGLIEGLAEAGFRAVAPFQRGYAPSTVRATTYESAALAGDLLGLAESLAGPAPVRVVGHDWGAVAALHAAAWRPERIERVVTLGMPHSTALAHALRHSAEQQRRSWYMFLFLARGFAERLVAADGFAFLARLVADWSPIDPYLPEEWEALRRTLGSPGVLEAALSYYRVALGQTPRDPALAEAAKAWSGPVDVPTLAIAGTRDGCIGRDVHEAQAGAFGGPFRLELVAGVGHWPHREAPEPVLATIAAFLRD